MGIAVVTGASRGIGRAVALCFASAGARVAITAVADRTALAEAQRDIAGAGADVLATIADVARRADVDGFVQAIVAKWGRIDILVNNAGVMTRPAPMVELEVRKWDYTIAVNLRGPFLVTQAVLPFMLKQKSGSIINVSSTLGRGAYPNFVAYATSKWGLEGFTQTLAAELSSARIRVNSVEPGYVATKLTGYRGSKPESVTDVFVYLGSDESKAVTGKMLSSSSWKSHGN